MTAVHEPRHNESPVCGLQWIDGFVCENFRGHIGERGSTIWSENKGVVHKPHHGVVLEETQIWDDIGSMIWSENKGEHTPLPTYKFPIGNPL